MQHKDLCDSQYMSSRISSSCTASSVQIKGESEQIAIIAYQNLHQRKLFNIMSTQKLTNSVGSKLKIIILTFESCSKVSSISSSR